MRRRAKQSLSSSSDAPVWSPTPDGPQEWAAQSKANILGFGGQAGGGKTYLQLGLASTQHYNAVIYRQNYPDLQDMVDSGNEMHRGQCVFNNRLRRWETPDGRKVHLMALERIQDIRKFRGRARDYIGFDEAQEFSEGIVRYLAGWLRTTRPGQRTRLVLTFNPPSDENGQWIVRYFAAWLDPDHPNPAEPGELRWYIRHEDEDVAVPDAGFYDVIDGAIERVDYETVYAAQSRTFIPASIDDNPYLRDTDYKRQLSNMPEPYRSQLLFGDFTIGTSDDEWQFIPTHWIDDAMRRGRDTEPPDVLMRALGIDVARGGKDETVLAPLFGNYFSEFIVKPGKLTPTGQSVLDLVILLLDGFDAYTIHPPRIGVDAVGVGSSAYDYIRDHYGPSNTYAFNAGAATKRRDKTRKFQFFNLRAYSAYLFREALDPEGGENICLPSSRQLRADLRALRYKIVSGKYKLESKDDIKRRIGRSPDYGDAAIIAWYVSRLASPADWEH